MDGITFVRTSSGCKVIVERGTLVTIEDCSPTLSEEEVAEILKRHDHKENIEKENKNVSPRK